MVIAGNHTLLAARQLGWAEIATVFTDDDDQTARAYALADNRTGELARWDYSVLGEHLGELAGADFDMTALGWSEHELEALLGATWNPGKPEGALEDFSNPAAKHSVSFEPGLWDAVALAVESVRERSDDPAMSEATAIAELAGAYLAAAE